jgi:hypothetical protein
LSWLVPPWLWSWLRTCLSLNAEAAHEVAEAAHEVAEAAHEVAHEVVAVHEEAEAVQEAFPVEGAAAE